MSHVIQIRPAGSTESVEFTIDREGTRLGDILARAAADNLVFPDAAVTLRAANGERTAFPSAREAEESEAVVRPGDEVIASEPKSNG